MPAPRGMKPTVNNPAQVLKRILNLVFKRYKFACIFGKRFFNIAGNNVHKNTY